MNTDAFVIMYTFFLAVALLLGSTLPLVLA